MKNEEHMLVDEVQYRYWEFAIPRIKEMNPKLIGFEKPNGNALNLAKKNEIQFVCLANRRKRVLPVNTIAAGFYIDIKKPNKTDEEKKQIKAVYDFLLSKRAEIESHFSGVLWNWHVNDDKFASSIYCYKKLDFTDESNWKECAEFHAKTIRRLYDEVFIPYQDEILAVTGRSTGNASKKKRILLSSVLERYGLNPEKTMLVRHALTNERAGNCFRSGFIGAYQSMQENPVFHDSTHVLMFMGESSGTTAVFIGLYKVEGELEGSPLLEKMPEGYPYPDEFIRGGYWYDLDKLKAMEGLEGELRIEWGKGGARAWHQVATNDKEVLNLPNDFPIDPIDNTIDEYFVTEEPKYYEDATGKLVPVKRYERNPVARWECLKANGYRCKVCGFDSAQMYGDDFKNKIEVHHIIPISERDERYEIDPKKDLIPVCPNCHTMLHSKTPDGRFLQWEDLRDIVMSRHKCD